MDAAEGRAAMSYPLLHPDPKVLQIQGDVRALAAMQAAAERTQRELGGIDIVVANAGYVALPKLLQPAKPLIPLIFPVARLG